MTIRIAATDGQIAACFPVMGELRPGIAQEAFVARIREQQKGGYRMAFVEVAGVVVAVAGFRVSENLAWGRFLYIEDLVTAAGHRGKGVGAGLLAWLRRLAVAEGCQQMHLDSGMQRRDAHRFYEREGLSKAGVHFVETLESGPGRSRSPTPGADGQS